MSTSNEARIIAALLDLVAVKAADIRAFSLVKRKGNKRGASKYLNDSSQPQFMFLFSL
jgi:hypothetical protein